MNIKLTSATLTKYLSYGPCIVHSIKGYNATAGDLFIQLHASPVVLAGAVPIIAGMEAPTGQWFDWFDEKGWSLGDCSIAISTTQDTYTAPAAGVNMTIIISTSTPACDDDGTALTTVVGDLTTLVASREIWAQASGPKHLVRLDIFNDSGDVIYPFISAVDAPATINSAQTGLAVIANGATNAYFFGRAGLSPVERVTSAGAHINRQGCTVVLAADPAVGEAVAAGASFGIRGVYIT